MMRELWVKNIKIRLWLLRFGVLFLLVSLVIIWPRSRQNARSKILAAIDRNVCFEEISPEFPSYRIAYFTKSAFLPGDEQALSDPFHEKVRQGIVRTAYRKNTWVITCVPDSQAESSSQAEWLNTLIKTEQFDGVILTPTNSRDVELLYAVQSALSADVPVITLDTPLTPDQDVLSHISIDNFQIGADIANWGIDRLIARGIDIESAQVIVLGGPGTEIHANARVNGHTGALIDRGVQVFAISGDWSYKFGRTVLFQVFQDNIMDPDLVIASNDAMALGASSALTSYGRDPIVVGVDGSPEGITGVRSGLLDATIPQPAYRMGEVGAETMVLYLKDKIVPIKLVEIPYGEVTTREALIKQGD